MNKSKSITTIDTIFSNWQQSEMKRQLEPSQPVHSPWKELIDKDKEIYWEPRKEDSYTGGSGGGWCGPSNAMSTVAPSKNHLCKLFFFIFPFKLIEFIAKCSDEYAYKEWVEARDRYDRDGNKTPTRMTGHPGCDKNNSTLAIVRNAIFVSMVTVMVFITAQIQKQLFIMSLEKNTKSKAVSKIGMNFLRSGRKVSIVVCATVIVHVKLQRKGN